MSGGPFVVTLETRERTGPSCVPGGCDCEWETHERRRAVATLGEAHALASGALLRGPFKGATGEDESEAVQAIYKLGPEGGKVPLPDGSEVKVAPESVLVLRAQLAPDVRRQTNPSDKLAVCAAWNAKHGIEAQDERGSRG
jgi:hypothetical protein